MLNNSAKVIIDNSALDNVISRDLSLALKGVAICLMLFHHLFTFPEWYLPTIILEHTKFFAHYLRGPSNYCVAIFAFLTGYAFVVKNAKIESYGEVGRKIFSFLLSYWQWVAIFFIVAKWFGLYLIDVKKFSGGGELLGLCSNSDDLMRFAWYVYFHVIVLLILPKIKSLFNKNIVFHIFIIAAIYTVRGFVTKAFPDSLLVGIFKWFPYVYIGAVVAKKALFSKLSVFLEDRISKHSTRKISLVVATIVFFASGMIGSNVVKYFLFPVFLFSLLSCILMFANNYVKIILQFLGRHSMNIWFIHCAVFDCLAPVTQPLIFSIPNRVWIFFITLAICVLLSVMMESFRSLVGKLLTRDNLQKTMR